jgi:hypothetical protein
MLIQRGVIVLSILGGSMAVAQSILHQPVNVNGVTEVHTTLDHFSILALPEKITRVAAGSDAMRIEWHDNYVFIRPLHTGQSTNLTVWTEHQFSTYELEAPGDVHSMSFVIDETKLPIPQPTSSSSSVETKPSAQEIQRTTDSLIGLTMLQVAPVVPRGVRPAKDYVSVLIKEVVRDKNVIYVRFAVTNNASHPYRVIPPSVFTIVPTRNAELLPSMRDLQVPEQATYQFQSSETAQVQVRDTAFPQKDVAPGRTVEGVLALEPADVQKARVYQFVFGNDRNHRIQATAVL